MEWWLWVMAGLALLALEVMIPGTIIFLFFGAAAIILGVLVKLGIVGSIWVQWVLFSLLSVISLMALRGPIVRRFNRRDENQPGIDSLVGQDVVLLTDLTPGEPGKAELRGTSWSVVGAPGESLSKGARCIVEKVEGLTLHLRAAETAEPGEPV
ncbi:MAG: NfeD family protein [Acidobacteria bacterium]|nr:NfeD family protein [Acidobacteriota bacterium]